MICGRVETAGGGRMLQAIDSALAGYTDRTRDISRLAERITQPDQDQAANMVGLMVNQRAAEANLVVAQVSDEVTRSLIHVIA
jgi:hypothetical protein